MTVREITARVDTQAGTLRPSDDEALRLTASRRNEASQLVARGLLDRQPPEDSQVQAYLNDTLVFTGQVTEPAETDDRRIKLRCFDAVRRLKNTRLTQTFTEAEIATIVRAAAAAADVPVRVDLPAAVTATEFDDTRCDEIITKMADLGNAVWLVTPDGTLRVTDDVTTLTTTHELEAVVGLSAGTATPAYQSVRVVGSSPASAGGAGRTGGREALHLISSSAVTAQAGEGRPQYTYRDDDIRTQGQAENVAQSVLRKFQAQQKGGHIDIAGDESIRPYDVVVLPDRLGGASYLVSEVQHRLSIDEGFVTRIECGGVIEP